MRSTIRRQMMLLEHHILSSSTRYVSHKVIIILDILQASNETCYDIKKQADLALLLSTVVSMVFILVSSTQDLPELAGDDFLDLDLLALRFN